MRRTKGSQGETEKRGGWRVNSCALTAPVGAGCLLAMQMVPWRLALPGGSWPELNGGFAYVDAYACAKGRQQPEVSVIEYYAQHHGASASRDLWLQRIAAGQVLVNGQPAAADQALRCVQRSQHAHQARARARPANAACCRLC